MAPVSQKEDSNWHLDKKVPISLILALFFQTVVGVMYVQSIANTSNQSAKDILVLQGRIQATENKAVILQESLIRLEEQSRAQTRILEKIERTIETAFTNNGNQK
jgi:ABC-type molybdate transport system ATPase subunit